MYILLFCLFSTNTLQEQGFVIGHFYIVHIVYNHGKSRKDHYELSKISCNQKLWRDQKL